MAAKYYKFLDAQDVHFYTVDETIRLGRLSYYRKLYEKEKDLWIADDQEGHSRLSIENMVIRDSATDPRAVLAAARVGIKITNSTNLSFGKISSIMKFDGFIFCASLGELDDLRKVMCEKSELNKHPYDAGLEITNVEKLHQLICGAKFADPVKSMQVSRFKPIQYRDISDAREYDHSVLVKRTIFAGQSEVRMIGTTQAGIPDDTYFASAHIPGLKSCFEQVF